MSTSVQPVLLDYYPDDEDYTLDAYIAAVPMTSNEVRFKYRPTDIIERSVYLAFREKATEKAVTEKLSAVMAAKIASWNLVRKEGNAIVPMEITADWVKRLKPSIWMRLVNVVVWGMDGGDPDPGIADHLQPSEVDDDMAALMKSHQEAISKKSKVEV